MKPPRRIALIAALAIAACAIAAAIATVGARAASTKAPVPVTLNEAAASALHAGRPLRVLFYGQSITAQAWSGEFASYFRAQYPELAVETANLAIGGHTSERLSRLTEGDVLRWQPDVVFFQVYGDWHDYQRILAMITAGTSAALYIATDHVLEPQEIDEPSSALDNWRNERLRGIGRRLHLIDARSSWYSWWNQRFLPAMARRYGATLIDVRGEWKKELRHTHEQPPDLLLDTIHLNARGNALMARIYRDFLDAHREPPASSPPNPLIVEDTLAGCRHFAHTYRVDLLADDARGWSAEGIGSTGRIERYTYVTRPSLLRGTEWPGLLHVRLGSVKVTSPQAWSAKLLARDADGSYRFRVFRGGEARGEGSTRADWTAPDRELVLAAKDWNLTFAEETFNQTWVGDEVRWTLQPGDRDPVADQGTTLVRLPKPMSVEVCAPQDASGRIRRFTGRDAA